MKEKLIIAICSVTILWVIYSWMFAIEPVIMGSMRTGHSCPTISFDNWKQLQQQVNSPDSKWVTIHSYLTYPGVNLGIVITKIFFNPA